MTRLIWRSALEAEAAFSEARAARKLVFVLFACPKEKRAAPILRAESPTLQRLLTKSFIPVHLSSLKEIDLSRFLFDYDAQLMGLVLTPEGQTLARWGGSDGAVESLVAFLERVKTAPWPKASVAVKPAQTLVQRFPVFAQTKRASEACYHCHYVHDAELAQQRRLGTFIKRTLYRYPPPSVLGITLDAALRVTALAPGSPAARAGLRVGERVTRLNGQVLYSAADLSFVLDGLPEPTRTLTLNGKRLALPKDWRVYDISHRPSQGGIPPLYGFWERPIPSSPTLALEVTLLFAGEPWRPSQGDLKVGDVIVAVDGQTLPQKTAPQLHTWLRMHKDVGQKVTLTVVRDGKRVSVTVVGVALDF